MTPESIIIVFVAGIVELWMAIPLGFLMEVNPVIITIVAASGAMLSSALVTVLGDNLRNRFLKWRYGDEKDLEKSRLYGIWNKYGVIGLGLTSPLLFGAPLGAAVGIALGADKNRLFLWMSIGIVLWSVGLTAAGVMGLLAFETIGK